MTKKAKKVKKTPEVHVEWQVTTWGRTDAPPTGWLCPICLKVVSPYVQVCPGPHPTMTTSELTDG